MAATNTEFLVNGVKISLPLAKKRGVEVLEIANKLPKILSSFDYEYFLSLSKSIPFKSFLETAFSVYPEETNKFMFHTCDEILKIESKPISVAGLYRYLQCGGNAILYREQMDKKNSGYKFERLNSTVQNYHEYLYQKISHAINTKQKQLFWDVSPYIQISDLLTFCLSQTKNEFDEFVKECANDFNDFKRVIEYNALYSYAMFGVYDDYDFVSSKVTSLKYNQKILDKYGDLFLVISKEYAVKQNLESSTWKYNFNDDIWSIYEPSITGFYTFNFDFSIFPNHVKNEIKQYIKELLDVKKKLKNIQFEYSMFKIAFDTLNKSKYEFSSMLDFNMAHVRFLSNLLQTDKNTKGNHLSISTQRNVIYRLRNLYDWVAHKSKIEAVNPFYKVSFNNSHSFSKRTKYIPEDIIEKMTNVFTELPIHVQNAWEIMMNTGMRVGDCLDLEEDCLFLDEKTNQYKIKFLVNKTKNKKLSKGKSPYMILNANKTVVKAVQKQMEITKTLRTEFHSKYIFLTKNGLRVEKLSSTSISGSINLLIEKYHITNADGSLFKYHNHQCRKTVGVELITKGASAEEVAAVLGHESVETTRGFYKDIELNKLAEMELSFFKEMFEEKLDQDVRNSYSEEEKQSLFKEVALGSRMTPEGHGICAKHVSLGPCVKRTCVGCKMLTSGPQFLPRLYKVRNEQIQYIEDLKNEYIRKGEPEYETFKEFQMVKHKLAEMNGLINNIVDLAERKGIPYEKEQ